MIGIEPVLKGYVLSHIDAVYALKLQPRLTYVKIEEKLNYAHNMDLSEKSMIT
jgi:hypothetical protein